MGVIEKKSQQDIKYGHMKRIYQLIQNNTGISRSTLAKQMGLSKTTVSTLVDELLDRCFIQDTGVRDTANQGRKPNMLHIYGEKNLIAVVNCQSQDIEFALITTSCEVVFKKTEAYSSSVDLGMLVKRVLHETFLPFAKKCSATVLGICVIIPGMIHKESKQIISTVLHVSNLSSLAQELRDHIEHLPIAILNDTACLAYAETVYQGIREKSYAFVNINQGVGTTIFLDGHMLRGANGMTTQFGHSSVDRHGPVCSCGGRGCLERLIGEPFLYERAQECGCEVFTPDVTFQDIGMALGRGSLEAQRVALALAEDLAFGLGNMIMLCHPELVVIGGRGVFLGDEFLGMVKANLQHMGLPSFLRDVRIRNSQLGRDYIALGAVRYYMDTHFSFQGDMAEKLLLF